MNREQLKENNVRKLNWLPKRSDNKQQRCSLFTVHCSLFIALNLFLVSGLCAQQSPFEDDEPEKGDAAVAEKYLLWAEDAIAAGHWTEARAALERAVDFADVSSDISFLLALARSEENESRRLVLQSLEKAIGTGRWKHYTEAQARIMEADQLITLRRYDAALNTLAEYKTIAGETADYALLRLAALKGLAALGANPGARRNFSSLPAPVEFRRRMLETIDNYPRDPRPLRILFDYARGHEPDRDDSALLEIALRRLPFLLESDPELAWMAAPFINNVDEARRLVAAYRAGSLKPKADEGFKPNAASIVQALNLGLLDDNDAIDELFTETVLKKEIIVEIAHLLRNDEGRDQLARKLHTFTGAITDDEDRDGYVESRAIYHEGGLQEYYCDTDQDDVTDLFVVFISGTPYQAEVSPLPLQEESMTQADRMYPALIFWERYPSVQKVTLRSETWLPAPAEFQFSPIKFEELGASNSYTGLLFPSRDFRSQGINRRMLASFAVSVQRPAQLGYGSEFEGGVEQVFLEKGIPIRAEVTLNGAVVSVTEFENGYPLIQRLDLDLDGRMETVRRFDRRGLRSSESDWHGGGVFGSAEVYREDGSIVYSWDLDGDGIRETVSR